MDAALWPLSVFAHTRLGLVDQPAQDLGFTVLELSLVLAHPAAKLHLDGAAHLWRKPRKLEQHLMKPKLCWLRRFGVRLDHPIRRFDQLVVRQEQLNISSSQVVIEEDLEWGRFPEDSQHVTVAYAHGDTPL